MFFLTVLSSLGSYLLMLESMFCRIPGGSLLSQGGWGVGDWEEWGIRLGDIFQHGLDSRL